MLCIFSIATHSPPKATLNLAFSFRLSYLYNVIATTYENFPSALMEFCSTIVARNHQ